MAKIEIHLAKGEKHADVEELLLKALEHHRGGEEHKEAFHQPSAREVFNKLIKIHDKEVADMLKQINKVIDEESQT